MDTFRPLALVRRHSDAALHCSYVDAVSTEWYFSQRRIMNSANADAASSK